MNGDFFIWCSGANRQILAECPTERTKFIGIGATIFTTAIMAVISGTYALYFSFSNYLAAIPLGLFWGVLIFNLDRYIVSSMRKDGSRVQQWKMAGPRLIIAIILGITISKPLELKLFNGTVTKELDKSETAYNNQCEKSFNDRRNDLDSKKQELQTQLIEAKNKIYNSDPILKGLQEIISLKKSEIGNLQAEIGRNRTIIKANTIPSAWSPTGRVTKWSYNATARERSKENTRLQGIISDNQNRINTSEESAGSRKKYLAEQIATTENQFNSQIQGVQQQIDDHNSERQSIIKTCSEAAAGDKDILSRLRALDSIKKFGNTVWWVSIMIMMIFIIIEVAPVLTKLLSNKGPYDEILSRLEHVIYLKQQLIISEKNNEMNNYLEAIVETGKLRKEEQIESEKKTIELESKKNDELMGKIADRQAEIAGQMLEEWYKKQQEEIK